MFLNVCIQSYLITLTFVLFPCMYPFLQRMHRQWISNSLEVESEKCSIKIGYGVTLCYHVETILYCLLRPKKNMVSAAASFLFILYYQNGSVQ